MGASGLALTLSSYIRMDVCSSTWANAAAPSSPILFSYRLIVVRTVLTFNASDIIVYRYAFKYPVFELTPLHRL